MRINLIGECDKRPVLYCLMKICQELGDVLVLSTNTYLKRLSDTGDTYGHYQNTMIGITDNEEGLDDFLQRFTYDLSDFHFVIIDNVMDPDADVFIYAMGYKQTENEKQMLEYLDQYVTIRIYGDKLLDANTPYKLEEFESLCDMCVVSTKLAETIAAAVAPVLGAKPDNIAKIALKDTSVPIPKDAASARKKQFLKGGKH